MPRIVRFKSFGGPEVLQIEDLEVPPPGAEEVKIRVKALGINRAECSFRLGKYLEQAVFPSKLGYEASGIVEAVGSHVKGFALGDAVSTIPAPNQGKYGVYGEVAIVPARYVVKNPEGMSFSDAAATWMQYLTAYGALIDIAQIKKGDFVAITAASSSVGLAAIQLCHIVGAIPIAITRKRAKESALKKAGANFVIVSDEETVGDRLKDISQGAGVRVMFDPIGGKGVLDLAEGMAKNGVLFQYGGLSMEQTPFPTRQSMNKGFSMRGYVLFEIVTDPHRLERGKEFILNNFANGKLKPIIAKTFNLNEIVEAHRYMESNAQFGKIVVVV